MSEAYQAIYDAVRSRMSNGDIGSVVREIAFSAFDISWEKAAVCDEFVRAAMEQQRPSVLMRPELSQDGNAWLATLHDQTVAALSKAEGA